MVSQNQKTIVIEARHDVNVVPIMDEISRVCSGLGHKVHRWRGPIAGAKHLSRRLPRCDVAILFNGTHKKYDRYRQQLRRQGATILFVELGWFPQKGTIQVDSQGINCAASWVSEPLRSAGVTKLARNSNGDLLLLLQDDRDTQITHHSPWFANMFEFVSHVAQFSKLPVRVRPHPRRETDKRVIDLVKKHGLELDRSQTLGDALDECRGVACINSSAAVEALARRLPVMCYGHAIYRHEGAVYCLDDDARQTRRITAALQGNCCELYQERVDEVVARIVAKQWCLEDIAARLPELLKTASVRTDANRPSQDLARSSISQLWSGLARLRRAG